MAEDSKVSNYVIFGGTGFIGTHLAARILQEEPRSSVWLVDIKPPRPEVLPLALQQGLAQGRAFYVERDVRQAIGELPVADVEAIFNLAAIHREPGHQPWEYFQTNLLGARNVCEYAEKADVTQMVFISSISVYGATEEAKDESSLTVPDSPYGCSKLVAEQIHMGWQKADARRRLVIVRPGVVFGAGEGGNVTRLVNSLRRGYFVYVGNQSVRKAGGYVKELCGAIRFAVGHQASSRECFTLINFSTAPALTMREFVESICLAAGIRRRPWSIPRKLLLGFAYPIDLFSRLFSIRQPVSPVRVRKLYRSTNIEARRLREMGYRFQYNPRSAFEDWKRDMPSDFS